MNIESKVRKNILDMQGYVPGEQPKFSNIVKLNTNENPYPPTPAVKKALEDFCYGRLDRYPDPVGQELRNELAHEHGVSADQIILCNGSDDTLRIIAMCFLDEKHSLAYPTPSYSLYDSLAELQNANVIHVPMNEKFEFPDDFEQKAAGANIAMIANPNSPTGMLYPQERIERLCGSFDGIALIDEAYADFSGSTAIPLLKKYDNLIVSRTFSKSRALAGLRFGYAVSSPYIISQLMKAKDSYNVSMITQAIALAALKDKPYLKEITDKIISERNRISAELKRMKFNVIPSAANFLFAAPPDNSGEEFFQFLRGKEIVVRYFRAPATAKYVRITVGLPAENSSLLSAAEEYISKR